MMTKMLPILLLVIPMVWYNYLCDEDTSTQCTWRKYSHMSPSTTIGISAPQSHLLATKIQSCPELASLALHCSLTWWFHKSSNWLIQMCFQRAASKSDSRSFSRMALVSRMLWCVAAQLLLRRASQTRAPPPSPPSSNESAQSWRHSPLPAAKWKLS